jgi:hypothetical protein
MAHRPALITKPKEGCLLPNRNRNATPNDLREVAARHQIAQDMTERFAAGHPGDIWRRLAAAFADIPALATEVSRLRAELVSARLDRANLAAAALAAAAALNEGEQDPLCYLRDELRAQGHDVTSSWGSR